jgi:glycine/D-amino acid oxidase-like deaminating enzyme
MPEYRHAVYWQDVHPVTAGEPLDTSVSCDVCIIGGGFTGMWTAHFLGQAEPDLDVRVVEQAAAGAAASGTADGFITPTVGKDLEQLVRRYGSLRTATLCDAVGRSILEIGRFVRRHGIDAEYEANDYLLVAVDDAQVARLERNRDLAARLGSRFEISILDTTAARQSIDSPVIRAAVRTGGALVNPFKLARGLLDVVRGHGVVVYEGTPAIRVEPLPDGYRVRTPSGSITARRIVLATSAHQHLLAGFHRRVLPMWSYALVSDPLTDRQRERIVWPGREGLVEAKTFLNCGRFTADNRIMWAGGSTRYFHRRDMRPERMRDGTVYRELRDSFHSYFPAWSDVRFRYAYGGCVDVTRDFMPHFGSRGPGLFHGYGYCGNGIAAAHLGGKVLRDLVLGRHTEYSTSPLVGRRERAFPPEPFAFCGARLTSRLTRRREARV